MTEDDLLAMATPEQYRRLVALLDRANEISLATARPTAHVIKELIHDEADIRAFYEAMVLDAFKRIDPDADPDRKPNLYGCIVVQFARSRRQDAELGGLMGEAD